MGAVTAGDLVDVEAQPLGGDLPLELQGEEAVVAAGHDAGILAQRIPAGMVFVRNASGVSHSPDDADTVWVTEVWDSKEDHDNSLSVAGVRELIGKAIPILDGPPQKGQELNVIGGLPAERLPAV